MRPSAYFSGYPPPLLRRNNFFRKACLHHLAGDTEKARAAFDHAEAEVTAMGYHWQDDELDKLRAAIA